MWRLIRLKSSEYLVDYEFNVVCSGLKIYISNFENFWSADFDEDQLIDTFKKCNPLIELDKTAIIKEIQNLFAEKEADVTWDINIVGETLKLCLVSTLGSIPFKFQINFCQMNNKMLFQRIVLPLLMVVKSLQNQNDYLCSIIKKKDLEISEYKFDGAVLSRKAVETPSFNETLLSHTFDENLRTVCEQNLDSLLDENVAKYLDKIEKLIAEEQSKTAAAQTVSSESEKLEDLSEEPPKKRLNETVHRTESKSKSIAKLEIPAIKKKPKNMKRLTNL